MAGEQKPLAAPSARPYQVVAKGRKTFTIQVGQRQEIISVDRLKAHTGSSPVSPAAAISRGRLPKKQALPSYDPAWDVLKPQLNTYNTAEKNGQTFVTNVS